ncbi:MAG TPA: Fur family transcriptional regulator [Actinomycetota bacterium]
MQDTATIVSDLRARGHRLTPQREAIIGAVLKAKGHIVPVELARAVQRRMSAVNPSTVYRTLSLLEDLGVLKHSHLEHGPEYYRATSQDHVHLRCARCGTDDDLSLDEAERLKQLIYAHAGFLPDLSHFAISGLCAACQAR